jgi:hypothetical protein
MLLHVFEEDVKSGSAQVESAGLPAATRNTSREKLGHERFLLKLRLGFQVT